MKIRFGSKQGNILILVAIVVAVVVIVGVGGVAIGKTIENAEKFKRRRDYQLTNDNDLFSQQMLEDYVKRTGDTNARVYTTRQTVTLLSTNTLPDAVLQWSTNLKDWTDVEGVTETTVDFITETALSPNAPAMMFWRVRP